MSNDIYKLSTDGDPFERNYWNLFIKDKFPSYEKFWLKFVVPLTNRPGNGDFKTDNELAKIHKSTSDICIAQLNYSILRHLAQCWHILRDLKDNTGLEQIDLLTEGFTRLVGAQDNAFEIMERLGNQLKYGPFLEKDGKIARDKYKKNNNYPLQHIRSYRNSLLHGRLLPGIIDGTRFCLPDIDKEALYLDWRLVTQLSPERENYKKDFISVLTILETAWQETTNYLEGKWGNLIKESYDHDGLALAIPECYRGINKKIVIPGMDSNISAQILLESIPVSGAITSSKKLKK
ncbi:MAG TPA: hypothetical protein VIK86_02820 [Candidatus Paceibacterota bacterium]